MILEGLQGEDNRFSQIFDDILADAEAIEEEEAVLNEAISEKEKFLEELESKKQEIDRKYVDLKKTCTDAATINILEKLYSKE